MSLRRLGSFGVACALIAACSNSSPETAGESGRPTEPEIGSATRSANAGASGETEAADPSGPQTTLLDLDAKILGKEVQVGLPYAKNPAYLQYIEAHALFQEALRVKAPAVLSSSASVAKRLAKIDELREETHAAYTRAGGAPFDPAITGFDAALADLLLAYFDMTKDAILASELPVDGKRAALAELDIESLDVLRWAPVVKTSISFYDTEGELALDSGK